MDSTYNENEYMPDQTGEQIPLPEPEEPRRVITSKETQPISQKKIAGDIDKPKRPVRRVTAPPKPNISHRGPGQGRDKPANAKSKLTILLKPELLTQFKIQALMKGTTYSQLAAEAFLSLLESDLVPQQPPKKKVIRPASSQTSKNN